MTKEEARQLVERMKRSGLVVQPTIVQADKFPTRFPQKIDDTMTMDIRRRRLAGETTVALAKAFGITPAYVSQIAQGKRRKRSLKVQTRKFEVLFLADVGVMQRTIESDFAGNHSDARAKRQEILASIRGDCWLEMWVIDGAHAFTRVGEKWFDDNGKRTNPFLK